MIFPYLIQGGYIRWRLLRLKISPWLTLGIAPLQWCLSSGVQRTHVQIRCMGAVGKIDFAGIYELLNDLIW